tara:strand:- start:37845 stop:38135 length:291 start_codon:yes stop_codon:yes gene_type:complete
MTTEAIAATTSQAYSASVTVADGASLNVFVDENLQPGEMVTLERTYNAGANWVEVVDPLFRGVVLNETTLSQIVSGPGVFRLNKTATTASTAVYYD